MGASRGRMLQPFLTENLLLVLLGGALGMALAASCTRLYTKLNLGNLPRGDIGVGGDVLLFALTVILLVSVLLACVFVAAFSKLDLNTTLKMGRSETGGVGKLGFRALVVSELSLAIVLLVAAGLLVRSYQVVVHVEPGFRPDHLLTTYFRTHYDIPGGERFFLDLSTKLSLVPGVQATAFASWTPGTWAPTGTLLFSDRPNDPNNAPTVAGCWVSPDFFRAIGSRLLQGRTFTERDDASAPPVVILNKALANSFWPGQNPIGKRIAVVSLWLGRQSTGEPRFSEVVGVVEDIKQQGLEKPFEPNVYLSFLQHASNQIYRSMNLFVRTTTDPRPLADTVRAQIRTEWPNQPIDSIETMQSVLFRTLAPRRLSLVLIGVFATLALFLSAIGIYGMIAYIVSLRTREFGLRLALGTQREDVLRLVLSEGFRMAAVGVTAGILASLLFSRFKQSLLFGVSSYDPLTFFAVAVLLTSIALLACYIPAHRAMRLDPMLALRYE
jgi:putative ABC transport system permease protein